MTTQTGARNGTPQNEAVVDLGYSNEFPPIEAYDTWCLDPDPPERLGEGNPPSDLDTENALALAETNPNGTGAESVFRRSWQPVDLDAVLAGNWTPTTPSVGLRSDGVGLFYPGKSHTISSESEGGKTWFALSACLDEINRGNHALYVDFEDDEGGIVGRLLGLGADRNMVRDRFHYLRPESPLGSGVHHDDLAQLLGDLKPTIGVIDGITEALTLHGLDPNSNLDVAKFGRILPGFIAERGPAAVSLDHVTKSTETRGRYALGAVHKLNGLDGAAYVLENRAPFGVGLTGRSTIKIAKDRPGQLRNAALTSSGGMFWAGDLVLESHAEGFAEVSVEAPTQRQGAHRPTMIMGRIMAALVDYGPLSQRRIRAAVTGKAATITQALDCLILDGYVTESTPHTVLKPYPKEDP
jgi:hypothetical protein